LNHDKFLSLYKVDQRKISQITTIIAICSVNKFLINIY
jgi:hypothetical protein